MKTTILASDPLADLPAPDLSGLPIVQQKTDAGGLVKRLNARHHRLAMALAEGLRPSEAAALCGYSLSRVSILQTDTLFGELVAFYASKRQEAFVGFGQKIADLGESAADELQARLEENPEKFTIGDLQNVLTLAADRSGHGPVSTQRAVSVTLSGAELARLKQQTLDSQPGAVVVIPAQSLGASAPAESAPVDSEGDHGSSPEGPVV